MIGVNLKGCNLRILCHSRQSYCSLVRWKQYDRRLLLWNESQPILLMPECVLEPKGNIVSLPFQLRAKMPAETARAECPNPGEDGSCELKSVGDLENRAEGGADAPRNGDSMLYALAAAAASRSSSPSVATKEDSTAPSPTTAHQDQQTPSIKREKHSPPEDNKYLSTATTSNATYRQENSSLASATSNSSPHEYNIHRLASRQQAFVAPKLEDANSAVSAGKHTNQLQFMEAMMQRQRQLYEEYGQNNNWMKIQRNDSNCLSKSKAKRYRWCVQKDNEKEAASESLLAPSASQYLSDSSSVPSHKKRVNVKRLGNGNSAPVQRVNTKRPCGDNTVPVHDKLYGSVFTGASKLRCRDCGKSFATLVDLTVHMSKTGHYRDENMDEIKGSSDASDKFVKPKNPLLMDLDEESAEKVLKCLGCGHSFDSLQDLTVHMIKTKHYEDVPSLRLYSQKTDYCNPANGILQPGTNEKTSSAAQLAATSSTADYPTFVAAEALKYPTNGLGHAGLNLLTAGSMPHAFANQQHSFANMLSMAALRLMGFPPYLMQMPFSNAVGGYDVASAAYAAAAARMLLSSPWLTQMPGLGAGAVFPPFLSSHPTTTLPPSMLPHARQHYSVAGDILSPAHSSSSSQISAHLSSPGARNGAHNQREADVRSRAQNQREADARQNFLSHALRCVQCGESFASLQQMTDHMRETTHFPIAMTPPTDETNHRRASASRCSSAGDSIFRGSPHSKGSPQQPPPGTGLASSPLEQLAKLASGRSLNETNRPSFARPNSDYEQATKPARKSSCPTSKSSPDRQRPSSNHSYPGESYVCPSSPRNTAADSSVAGFDFIKSLESTIQSAISRVNQPSGSPGPERQVQSSRDDANGHNKSRKHRILDSFLPTTNVRVHRKSLPSNCEIIAPSAIGGYHTKPTGRPASDGEEYYHKEKASPKETTRTSRPVNRKQRPVSPPLDLSNRIKDSASKSTTNKQGYKEAGRSKNPIQCIKDDMQSFFEAHSPELRKAKHAEKRFFEDNDGPDAESLLQRTKKRQKISVDAYNPGLAGANPLKEIQKIVNATEVTVKEGRHTCSVQKTVNMAQKRKLDTETLTKNDLVRDYKACSVLSDLVRHDEDDPLPEADPLAQMENLVNLKIGRSAQPDNVQSVRKPNLAKPYFPLLPDTAEPSQNGTNPMSALLNLFPDNGKALSCTRTTEANRNFPAEKGNSPKRKNGSAGNGQILVAKRSNDTDQLKEKMVEFFRSMIARGQPLLDKSNDSARRPSSPPTKRKKPDKESLVSRSLNSDHSAPTALQEMRLQALFATHYEKKTQVVAVSDRELKSLATETGLSTASIKEWVSGTEKQLRDHGRCDFLSLPTDSNSSPPFRCTWCGLESARGLSVRDFLHHLSTHIEERDRANSASTEGALRKDDREMLYRGAVHFKSLNSDDGSTEFSLAPRVAEPSAEATSPVDVAAQQRNHVDVMEDGPIKVSG